MYMYMYMYMCLYTYYVYMDTQTGTRTCTVTYPCTYAYTYMYVWGHASIEYMHLCRSIHLSIYLPIYLPAYPASFISSYLSLCLSVHLSICLSIFLVLVPSRCPLLFPAQTSLANSRRTAWWRWWWGECGFKLMECLAWCGHEFGIRDVCACDPAFHYSRVGDCVPPLRLHTQFHALRAKASFTSPPPKLLTTENLLEVVGNLSYYGLTRNSTSKAWRLQIQVFRRPWILSFPALKVWSLSGSSGERPHRVS